MIIKKSFNPICSQVLYLASWPSLDSILQENVLHITRICALLARRPSVGAFIPVILEISHDIIFPLLEMLYAEGHIYQEEFVPVEHVKQFEKNITKEEEISQETVMLNYEAPKDFGKRTPNKLSEKTDISFFENLWKRLTNNDKFGQPKLV